MQTLTIETSRLHAHCWVTGPENGVTLLLVHGNLTMGRFFKSLAEACVRRGTQGSTATNSGTKPAPTQLADQNAARGPRWAICTPICTVRARSNVETERAFGF